MPRYSSRPALTPFLALLFIAVIGCAPADEPGAHAAADAASPDGDLLTEVRSAAEVIDEATLRIHIAELSSDEMGGRGPGSEGDRMAREYLIEQMKALGLEPGGENGSWEQPFDIVRITSRVPDVWTFETPGQSLDLQSHDQFIAFAGVQEEEAAIENAEVVFVGYGIEAPEYDWNDFDDVDVSGKVLLILNNDPDWDPELFDGDRRLYYGRWDYKYEKAAEKGAVGAIIHHTRPPAGYPFGVVQSSWTGPQFELPATGEPRLQVAAWTVESATRELVALGGFDLDELVESAKGRDFQPVPLGITTSLAVRNEIERTQTANVLGKLSGSDGELADQHVIYGAHFDHLGIGEPDEDGDTIYNGALDNASGSAAVLAVAKAMKELSRAPRRSTTFAFWAAEEQGLLGSEFFAQNPPMPAGKMAANVNIDGGNIFGKTHDIVFIGYGKSSLDEVVRRWAGDQGRTVKPDQFPDRGFFYRSDQFNLAKIGVPAIYLDNGVEFVGRPAEWGREQIEAWEGEHYHQQSDELNDTWSFDGMVQDTRLYLFVGVDIAEASEMPRWAPGDEFEDDRQAALAALAGDP
ncbi:MAG: M28 family peptidase [Thermoanaerobaculia bacterium]|nr:M28 family peptidase [Thermoanaerobaculia bacterium]